MISAGPLFSGAALPCPDATLGDDWRQRQCLGTECCGWRLYIKYY